MQPHRLATGGRIRRDQPYAFRFNGRALTGYAGDTLASALLANDVALVARSFKYHRPRGIVSAGSEEPSAFVQLGRGPGTRPNQSVTRVELTPGLEARSSNCWPTVGFDVMGLLGMAGRVLPPGFYYKTFMAPANAWPLYERVIRATAGLGRAPDGPDPDHYDAFNAHCDVLVAGGGPAGLAAALAAGRAGARVILADEQVEFGGQLLGSAARIDGAPGLEWVRATVAALRALPEVRLLPRTTVFGHYAHNWLGALEQGAPDSDPESPRERLWRIRARQVVNATGAIERPLVFANNDRPGVMLASAVSTYLLRYGVTPGRRVLLFTNNDSAYQTALDLANAGVRVVGIVDPRPDADGPLQRRVRTRDIAIFAGHAVVDTAGRRRIRAARISPLSRDATRPLGETWTVGCDVLAVSGGWDPAVHLHAQSGGRPRWDTDTICFRPGDAVQPERSAGACNGNFALRAALAEGVAAGAGAAVAAGVRGDPGALDPPTTDDAVEIAPSPMWTAPTHHRPTRGPKRFVDLQEDVTVADLAVAVGEGYQSIEHVKRYTTTGMGLDQGRTGNVNALGIVAGLRGMSVPDVGVTTFRPPYTPVGFGAVAGRNVGELADPVRTTPLQAWHVAAGARFETVGQWRRAWYYPQPGEDLRSAVNRECLAVRRRVGILDYSTLGKLDIQGPDAAELLSRVYTNDWRRLRVGRCRYGLMLSDDGMILDDGVTARLGRQHYRMFTSTGGAATVLAWLERWLQTEWPDLKVYLTSVSDQWSNIALAGPASRAVLQRVTEGLDVSARAFPFMTHQQGTVAGAPARIFRISFSGELSYEINVPADDAQVVWEALMQAGRRFGITPYGTEAMHVLRAEKGFIIVGQETDGTVTPHDVGLEHLLSRRKDFLGRRALARPALRRPDRKQLVGLVSFDRTDVLPEGGQVLLNPADRTPGHALGHVTSSYYSAALGRAISLAMIARGRERRGATVYITDPSAHVRAATVTDTVFYDPDGARQRV